ncbi:MAG: T9SS type A sorting domain-containing protein [Ignavibacteriae bacterium]|nr:T9SS type A sorting domain-containing protein [Ignavibacteriota bacterium]
MKTAEPVKNSANKSSADKLFINKFFTKSRLVYLVFFLCVVFGWGNYSNAQPFVPNPDMDVVNNTLFTITVDGNFTYVGGDFNIVGPNVGYGAKLTTSSWIYDSGFPKINGYITTVVADGSGGWYIGGDFTKVGSYNRNRIARINSNGTVHAWNPNADADVRTIFVSGSDVYVGGSFNNIGGAARNYIAKLNSSGTAESWNPNADVIVNTIAISGSDVYVGGGFNNIGGAARNYIAKLNSTGTAESWNPNADNEVKTIVINGSEIYAGGYFSNIGGQNRNGLAKLNPTTGLAEVWNPDPGGGNSVSAIAISGSDVYVGGGFDNIGGVTRNNIAKLDKTTGLADPGWNANIGGSYWSNYVFTIALNESDIYIGGYFTSIGGLSRNNIAKLNSTTGATDPTWNPMASDGVTDIAINGSDIFIGGSFTIINGLQRNCIARIDNTTGKVDPLWNPNANANIRAFTISGSDIYVAGEFTSIGGLTRNRIAKLDKITGAVNLTFNPNANNSVFAITVSGSDIFVGGRFTKIGGVTRNRIARINSDGTLNSWNPGAQSEVYALALSGNDIYVGGSFASIGGETRYHFAKFNTTTGNLDATWNPNGDDTPMAFAIYGGNIYAVGWFSKIGGVTRNYLAKLNSSNGAADPDWNPNSGNAINSIAINSSGIIYVGGWFNTMGGLTRNYIARLNNTDGAPDAWNPDANSYVFSVFCSGDDVYAGGQFSTMGGNLQTSLALFTDRPLPVTLTSFIHSVNGRDVNLKWVTDNEINNAGFEILRAVAGSEYLVFSRVGYVKGRGTTNTPITYTFTDSKLSPGKYSYRLKQIDNNGNFEYHNLKVTVEIGIPAKFSLSQNYPNPFNPTTKIDFSIPFESKVSLNIYDITGRNVMTIINKEFRSAGYYSADINAGSLGSGIYFYRFIAESNNNQTVMTKKMMHVK